MRIIDLRKKSDKDLIQIKKDLEKGLVKASGKWVEGNVSKKESGQEKKAITSQGTKTKLKRDIQRNIAQINTMLEQRGLSAERCKDKPRSKRRDRRLRGRAKQ